MLEEDATSLEAESSAPHHSSEQPAPAASEAQLAFQPGSLCSPRVRWQTRSTSTRAQCNDSSSAESLPSCASEPRSASILRSS